MIYGGDGLGRLPFDQPPGASEDSQPSSKLPGAKIKHINLAQSGAGRHGRGKAVFVPFVLPDEEVEATLTEEKPGYARAQADAIVRASPRRVKAGCRYFGECGGCQYQHADYSHQLEIKKDILRETLRRFAKLELRCEIEVHPSPPWNYRNRSRLQVRAQPEFAAGYFRFGSHEVLAVEECPISSPLINRAIAALWQIGSVTNIPEGVREIEFFANADDTRLLAEISCAADARRAIVRGWAEDLRGALPEIVGVMVIRAVQGSNREVPRSEKLLSVGAPSLRYETQRASYQVSAGAFFQTNRHMIDELVGIVSDGRHGEHALDLYAGVGLFSTALARDFRHVIAVESSQTSTEDLAYNLGSEAEVIRASTEQYLSRLQRNGRAGAGIYNLHRPDLAVVDPPRGGLGERTARQLAELGAPRVTYVSCDPATLARDLAPFLAAGYRVEEAHLIDLFPQTFHLESVLKMRK